MDEPVGSDNSETVPLADVDGVILRKVIEWCERHKDGFLKFNFIYFFLNFRSTKQKLWRVF